MSSHLSAQEIEQIVVNKLFELAQVPSTGPVDYARILEIVRKLRLIPYRHMLSAVAMRHHNFPCVKKVMGLDIEIIFPSFHIEPRLPFIICGDGRCFTVDVAKLARIKRQMRQSALTTTICDDTQAQPIIAAVHSAPLLATISD